MLAPGSVQPDASRAQARPSTLRSVLSKLTVLIALGYLAGLVVAIVAFRWVGEQWWVTVVAMYLPRIGFAIPWPFVVIAAAWWAPRWVLATQTVSAYLVLFPLMGLHLGLGRESVAPGTPTIRIVSYNVHDGAQGLAAVVAEARSLSPDVVLMQEAYAELKRDLCAAFAGWNVEFHDEFFVAARWPIREVSVPADLVYEGGRTGRSHYIRYALETPLGLVDVFSVHPISPREGFDELRGRGFRDEVQSGRVFTGLARAPIEFNALRRRRQVADLAKAARRSLRPVIIAGDTNLPDLSWVLVTQLGDFQDGFSSAGSGFGYTFPSKRPWMRIDRVMTNDKLKVTDLLVGTGRASDHLCVVATIAGAD
jgi:vancomycin resistance protein VanJ